MRHSILTKHIEFEHKAGLVLDARSITQLLYMHSIIGDRFSEENTILLWKGRKSDLLLASKLIELPKNYYILDIDSREQALMFDFKAIKNIKNICKSIASHSSNAQLCTSFASGMYFELLKSLLPVEDDDVIQFDDGLINEFIVVNKYRLFKFIIYFLHGFICLPSKYRLFSDERFKRIYTSISPDNIVSIENKQVVDISDHVSKNFYRISLEHINIDHPKSAILMTTHSVESGRMAQSEYHQLITDVYSKLQGLGIKYVYLSKHPAEKHSNNDFYNKIGLIATYQDYPSELLVANKNIAYIANPCNSTIMMSNYFKHLNGIDAAVSYYPKNSPYKDERIKRVDKILSKHGVEHYVL
jgi:hypothetical protein